MLLIINRPPNVTLTTSLFPYTTLFRSGGVRPGLWIVAEVDHLHAGLEILVAALERAALDIATSTGDAGTIADAELQLGGHQIRIKPHPSREPHDQREGAPGGDGSCLRGPRDWAGSMRYLTLFDLPLLVPLSAAGGAPPERRIPTLS